MQSQIIFDFDIRRDINNWRVLDDIVMGGRSLGNFDADKNGHGVLKAVYCYKIMVVFLPFDIDSKDKHNWVYKSCTICKKRWKILSV